MSFPDDVKIKTPHADLLSTSQEAGMMYTFDKEAFLIFRKNAWIGDSVTFYHITNDDSGLYNITDMNKLVQEST